MCCLWNSSRGKILLIKIKAFNYHILSKHKCVENEVKHHIFDKNNQLIKRIKKIKDEILIQKQIEETKKIGLDIEWYVFSFYFFCFILLF